MTGHLLVSQVNQSIAPYFRELDSGTSLLSNQVDNRGLAHPPLFGVVYHFPKGLVGAYCSTQPACRIARCRRICQQG